MAETVQMDDWLLWLRKAQGRAVGKSTQGSAQPAMTPLAPSSSVHCLDCPWSACKMAEAALGRPSSHNDLQGMRPRVGSRNFLERKRNLVSQKLPVNFSSHLIGLNLVS